MKTNTLKSFLTITLAMFIISIAIYFFLIPSEVITGSVTGLAMVLAKITSLSISTLTFVINALLLILGIVLIGKEFGAKTIYASLLLPLFLAVFEKIYPNNISLTQNAVFDMATYTLILAFGQTILFRVNASSGGTDIIAKIVNKYTHMDLGKACTLVGLLICTTSLIVYDIGALVVGALATLANGQAVDYFIDGFNKKKKICILSKEYEVIQDYIMNTLKRGVTLYSAKGGYDKTEHTELVTIMATNEYKKLLYYLQESDIEAFVTVSTVNEVIGTWNNKKRVEKLR